MNKKDNDVERLRFILNDKDSILDILTKISKKRSELINYPLKKENVTIMFIFEVFILQSFLTSLFMLCKLVNENYINVLIKLSDDNTKNSDICYQYIPLHGIKTCFHNARSMFNGINFLVGYLEYDMKDEEQYLSLIKFIANLLLEKLDD